MEAADGEGRNEPAGPFKALTNPLLHIGAEQQRLVGPALQHSGALLQVAGASPQQNHPANTLLQQPLQLGVAQFPAGITALLIIEVSLALTTSSSAI